VNAHRVQRRALSEIEPRLPAGSQEARLEVRLAELAAMGRAEPAGDDAILAGVEALKAEGVLIERTRP
jgi:hypothetical protein